MTRRNAAAPPDWGEKRGSTHTGVRGSRYASDTGKNRKEQGGFKMIYYSLDAIKRDVAECKKNDGGEYIIYQYGHDKFDYCKKNQYRRALGMIIAEI